MLVFVSQVKAISQLCLCLFHRGKVFLSCACVCFTVARYFSVVLVFVSQGHGEGQCLAPEEGKTLVLFSPPYLSFYSEKR